MARGALGNLELDMVLRTGRADSYLLRWGAMGASNPVGGTRMGDVVGCAPGSAVVSAVLAGDAGG